MFYADAGRYCKAGSAVSQTDSGRPLACNLGGTSGSIAFVHKAMLKYRQHSRNQTGILSGVTDKESYRVKRILPLKERLNMLKERIDVQQNLQDFVQARIENRVLGIWKGRKFSPKEAGFEIIMNLLPEKLFQAIISRIRK